MGIKERLEVETVPSIDFSIYERQFDEFKRKMETRGLRPRTRQGGLFQNMFMPWSGRVDRDVRQNVTKTMGQTTRLVGQSLQQMGRNQSVKQGFGALEKGVGGLEESLGETNNRIKESIKLFKELSKESAKTANVLKSSSQSMRGGAGGGGGGGRGQGGGFWGSRTGRGVRAVGRGSSRMLGMMGGGIFGFAMAAYQQGVANYEQMSQAQLGAAPQLVQAGPGGRFNVGASRRNVARLTGVGARYGYNAAETAGIAGQAGQAGYGVGPGGVRAAMQMQRAMGPEGLAMGGQLMRVMGQTGQKGAPQMMMKQMSKAMAVGVKTGLDEARIGEFLKASVDYAEQQLAITPEAGKEAFKLYTRELGLIQERGGAGMRGRYGAAALGRVDQAIKGAQGAQQSFMLRAFGFGQGTSFFDALRRQEQGIAGKGKGGESNLMAVMKQLRGEYGAGPGGGLSKMGMLAFKNLGMGSTFMAEKMSKIYLQRQRGEISAEDAQKKIKSIQEKEKMQKYPMLQRKAWAAMEAFGGVARLMAGKWNSLAKFGGEFYKLKDSMTKMSMMMLETVKPLMEAIKKSMPTVLRLVQTVLPILQKVLEKTLSGIMMIVGMIGAFFKGAAGKGFFGGIKGGLKSAGEWAYKNVKTPTGTQKGDQWTSRLGIAPEEWNRMSLKEKMKRMKDWEKSEVERKAKIAEQNKEMSDKMKKVRHQRWVAEGSPSLEASTGAGLNARVAELLGESKKPQQVNVNTKHTITLKPAPGTPPSRRAQTKTIQESTQKPAQAVSK